MNAASIVTTAKFILLHLKCCKHFLASNRSVTVQYFKFVDSRNAKCAQVCCLTVNFADESGLIEGRRASVMLGNASL